MKQSRTASLIESLVNIGVGLGLSIMLQGLVLPLLGVPIPLAANLAFAGVMTVVSIARQFVLRRVFEALHIRRPLSPALQAIIAERFRQIEAEGFDAESDDRTYENCADLARAGAAYAVCAAFQAMATPLPAWIAALWPWNQTWWKPQGVRRDLARAGALIVAALEHFDRGRKNSPERLPDKPWPRSSSAKPSKFERFGSQP